MPLTPTQRAYIAGIVDGEGTIFLTQSCSRSSAAHYYIQVKVANTDWRLIVYLKETVGKGSINYKSRLHEGCKDVYHWGVASNQAYDLLVEIRDYLVVKQEQADVCIALWEENRAALAASGRKCFGNYHPVPTWLRRFREACFWYLKDLNRRGPISVQHGDRVMALITEIESYA